MCRTVAIVQSNYIPWKGYFDLINMVDEFILFDDAQYTKRDWRNRNLIKSPLGLQWLTIPVHVKGEYYQKICDTKVADASWPVKHWKSIVSNYGKAQYFKIYKDIFEKLYIECREDFLSRINVVFIQAVCNILGIQAKLSWSMDYMISEWQKDTKTKHLVSLCKAAKASRYISGPSAKAYIDKSFFDKEGIELSYIDYYEYPEYTQLFGNFEHRVSIIDLLFNEGPRATKFMKSF